MSRTDLDAYRRFFAEDIQITSNLGTAGLVEALATVPRERFLPPGPWIIRGEGDFQSPPRRTPSDDPRFVYHNISVGLDADRMLFNGAPGLIGTAIDALALTPGDRVLHIGAGTGYYTAILAHTVGPSGRVVGIEVDESLAAHAAAALEDTPWSTVHHGDGRDAPDGPFDAILVNAGVTHPEPAWLNALVPAGRMVVPFTAALSVPGMPPPPIGSPMAHISKGLMLRLTKTTDEHRFDARVVTFVAIYSAIGLRDATVDAELGQALKKMPFAPIATYRTDAHDTEPSCWCHTDRGCLGLPTAGTGGHLIRKS